MRLKLTVAYDGTGFRGWAAQPGLAHGRGGPARGAGDDVRGVERPRRRRPDGHGVHALANVASVDVGGGPPAERTAEALNAALPDDVAVVAAEEAPPEFHARFSARSRSYRYRIWRSRTRSPFEAREAVVPAAARRARLEAQAAALCSASTTSARSRPPGRSTTCSCVAVEAARWIDDGDVLLFEITAGSFLRHMVRTLVGTMIDGDRRRAAARGAPARARPVVRRRRGPLPRRASAYD